MSVKINLKMQVVISVFLVGLVAAATAVGGTIYVDADATGANDGSSWENAYNFLQDALADANSSAKPAEIRVAQGIYTPDSNSAEPNGTGDREATFQLINGVALKGGYAGAGAANPDARNIHKYETILSGDLDGNDIDGMNSPSRNENSYHVVSGSGINPTAVLNGFTVTAGNANGTAMNSWPGYAAGGGMFNGYSGSPTVTNCSFKENFAEYGGGLFNGDGSHAIVKNCTFSGNWAVGNYPDGGAIFSHESYPTVTNCTFTGNFAPKHPGCYIAAGGIASQEGTVQITNCIVWRNTGIQIYGANVNYTCVEGGAVGFGNMDSDPCFAEPGYWADANDPNIVVEPNDPNAIWIDGDYHLKSQAGRWDPNSGSWVKDDVTSSCIDAGNPLSPIGFEPFPNGGIINMGAYGGTAEASKSYSGKPVCETIVAGDINGDCKVNFLDFALMAFHWLEDNSP